MFGWWNAWVFIEDGLELWYTSCSSLSNMKRKTEIQLCLLSSFTFPWLSGSENTVNSPLAHLEGGGWGVGPRLGGKMGKHKGKLPLLYVDFHAVLCAQSLMQCSQGQFSREGFAFAHHTLQSGGSLPYPDILVQIERVWTVKVQYCFGVYYNQVPER